MAALLAVAALPELALADLGALGPFDDGASLPATTGLLVQAAAVPSGFQETVAFSGLTNPSVVRFSPDGRVFVALKSGRILEYDDLSDTTPTLYADLSTEVQDYWDRGLLGMVLDPQFPARPYIYVLYTYDKDPSAGQVPRWGDTCPTPPGPTGDGCVVSARLSRLDASGNETPLIEDWCQQYPSHSIGTLEFGPDGALYVSGGEGASFNFADWGQDGSPVNPCGDPPGGRGGSMTAPTAEGGALRSQDVRTTADPTGLNGAILRVDPDSGAALPGNPNSGSSDANARRIIAMGFRNPFRFTFRPGTDEIWAGDVGWNDWEEIDRITSPTASMKNAGWPCYEGNGRQPGYDSADLNLCESLYSQGSAAVLSPFFTYNHSSAVVGGENCSLSGSSISGLAFQTPGQATFPSRYDSALFFADYSRRCIWAMLAGTNGLPDPARIEVFDSGINGPVYLTFGPGGDLFYADLDGGTIMRIHATNANRTPTAVATASPTTGLAPLAVDFDGTGSSDPEGGSLTYSWDLNGDGTFGDSTAARPSFTYTADGAYTVRLRVADPGGLSATTTVTVQVGNPPTASVDSPADATTWKVGDTLAFSGHASDAHGNAIAASGLHWALNLEHCTAGTGGCHTHFLQTWDGVAGGSFVTPDHGYPSHLELKLTATDSSGLSTTVTRVLNPRTAQLTVTTAPAGLKVTLGSEIATAPMTREVIIGSTNGISVASPQVLNGKSYTFSSWSDGSPERAHNVVAGAADQTITATFAESSEVQLAGLNAIGDATSSAAPGKGEAYRTTAGVTGDANVERLYLDSASNATQLVLGVYGDAGGEPGTLLARGSKTGLTAGAWNEVTLAAPVHLVAGTPYWIALLNPVGGTGTLRWRDHADGIGGSPERTSGSQTLTDLATSWTTGAKFTDGPVSGYLVGGAGPGTPALAVAPSSMSFTGTAGGANPPSQTVSVTNPGGGSLSFTDSDTASWLSVTPDSGTAPKDLTAGVDLTGLAAGTYTTNITIDAGSAQGSPKTVPVTLTVNPAGTATKLAGADVVGAAVSQQAAGAAEAYRTTATAGGPAAAERLYVDTGTTATALTLGIYADNAGEPGALLASGRSTTIAPGAWNEVTLTTTPTITSGQPYWIGLLGTGGTLRWRDQAGGSGGAERVSQSKSLTALPATWATGGRFSDGPVSAYIVGPSGPPPPPALSVTPTSLSFSATQGGSNPPTQTVSVTNTGGGTLTFTAAESSTWLSLTPAGGTAPRDLTISVDISGLAAATYTTNITVDGGTAQGSPKTIPVTLTVNPPAPPALAVSPSSLSFAGTVGGASPPAQALSVTNTGGATLSFTAADDAPWLSESPASGTAPQSVNVTPSTAGLAAGTYAATVAVTAPGATGSPKTVPVTLTVTSPSTGLVGAWGFDEISGPTAVDASGQGNNGTISGATRSTAGRSGAALSFDGVNDWVTVPDANSLDLTTGMTLEAWVRPAATGTVWRTVLLKEQPAALAYSLYANTNTQRPSGHVFTTAESDTRGTAALALNAWTHLAVTYDGANLRIYVNGTQASSKAVTGAIKTSNQPLRIGGNGIWSEWFQGLIDEVRVYNRALTAAQIQTDMNAPVTPGA